MTTVELPTTQRAYTLRLRGVDGDTTWRDALWATHEAVNGGAKVFGDWILTLRGGLDHRLADDGPAEQRKDRRILLALSWLSVEDKHGAPKEFVVDKPVDALLAVLASRGLTQELAEWKSDCAASLSARIRDDAVWVNRSAAFEEVVKQCPSLTRNEIWDFLEPFFVSPKAYLHPEKSEAESNASAGFESKDDKAKDLVQKAGGWLSRRMGGGTGADFARMAKANEKIAAWAKSKLNNLTGPDLVAALTTELADFEPRPTDLKGIVKLISGPGYKGAARSYLLKLGLQPTISDEDLRKLMSWAAGDAIKCAEKVGGKGRRAYSDMIVKAVEKACGFTYLQDDGAARHCEFSVMLDHAARRVNVAHSWIKNAEAERRQFEADSERIANVAPRALAWLESYCTARKESSGALEPYRIRKRAIDAWDLVVERWCRADCKTMENRIRCARDLQDDPEVDKFGDIQLFEALADDDAECVWKSGDTVSAQALKDFVFATDAMAKRVRFKVPAFRHPDPLRHPVFADFGNSRWDIHYAIHERFKSVAGAKRVRMEDERWLSQRTGMRMKLWNGKSLENTELCWSCKRLGSDLAMGADDNGNGAHAIEVSRADRLGRAAARVSEKARVTISGLFDEKDWNGRLQAPRAQLDAIARHVEKQGWDAKAQTMVKRIHWLLSFSAKLTPQGPWTGLAAKLGLKTDPQYWPHADANKHRKGHGRLILSRLPGLRVLAVDLGHRFAAACAVWEAVSTEQIYAACKAAGVAAPSADAMYIHVKTTGARGKDSITIYRRIGADTLPDGSAHPAPWARLDRQFLIKLQGEDRAARKASQDEITAVEKFETWAGLCRGTDEPPRTLAVDALMSDAVRSARLALARHSRRARIAQNLTATTRVRPGGVAEPLTEATRSEMLLDVLTDWHALATDDRWNDSEARTLWNIKLARLSGGFEVERRTAPRAGDETSKAERKQEEASLRARLEPLARTLAATSSLTKELHDDWSARWQNDDHQWHKWLKWLSRWLMPRGGKRRDAARRHVGGLSLTRLASLVEFRRKVQVGFFTRMKPDGSRAELAERFGQSTLDAIERLKDSRVKQLASRIVEAALGVGIERHSDNGRDLRRARERIHGPRFAPCHAVIIEDLTHYRPEETRTRRENRATMDWKSAETRKRLEDACQLHGLHLRDVNPQYTSRQDSRTGAPGARFIEIEVRAFLASRMWKKQIRQAERKREEGKGDARDAMLLDLHAQYKDASGAALMKLLRIPLKGGDLFASADPRPSASGGIQADLNAAANIGLRALMDPDFPGRWWYVPCDPKTKTPKADKVKGGLLDDVGALAPVAAETVTAKTREKRKGKTRDVVNLWRDPSPRAITGNGGGDTWSDTAAYWNRVQMRVINLMRSGATG